MKIPQYLRVAHVLVAIVAAFFILYIGSEIILPIIFSIIIAILLNPVVNFLENHRMNRVFAIFLALFVMFLVIFGIFFFIGAQISMFREALPELTVKATGLFHEGIDWVSYQFGVQQEQVDAWIERTKSEGMTAAGGKVGSTILSISSVLVLVFLVPVYIFLFLFYKPLLLTFISKVFSDDHSEMVAEVLTSTKTLIQSYLRGLLIEMGIVALLNSTALLIIGVDYAIALGVIGAILNLIPYIGGIVAIALPVIMSLVSGTPLSVVFVVGAYLLIQIVDNNFLVPMVVASKVKVNALVSIIVVLIGGALWGVAGMFLSIPITAIVKVICDKVPNLQAYGYLIGDDMPEQIEFLSFRKKIEEKNEPE